ncbi:MAG: DNA repair protein RecN [Bacteroidetes bacterium]|nr:DNA repair protein RecN [Bacteroidota bacterium]
MLSHLYIENYALIEKLDINLSSGFSVITGETGAGKSIIIGAVSLILGQRADTAVLLNKSTKCIVEGSFDISKIMLNDFFASNELDNENPCILRREITPNGKSRAFINDTPVNLMQLKEIGERLVDIHSQHNALTLNNSEFQMAVVDNMAGNSELLKQYTQEFRLYQELKHELADLKEKEKLANTNRDYLQFLFDELDNAALKAEEEEEITKELELQNNAEEIKTALFKTIATISQSEINVLAQLNELQSQISKIVTYHPQIKEIAVRLQSCIIELKDIGNEAETIEEKVNFDAAMLEQLTQRLDLIYRLEKKHSVNTVTELIEIYNKISDELLLIASFEDKILVTEKLLQQQYNKVKEISTTLCQKRKQIIPTIETTIKDILFNLGMETAVLKIALSETDAFSTNGINDVIFLFNANKGGELRELSKVISGGELSRLMLAIKSIISKQNMLPTVIFDEIDSGVSGDIAGKVGLIMKKMAADMQLIAITHLPQIAAKADVHYFVTKQTDDKRTLSLIKQLNGEEKIIEIAKMLSNENVTISAMENAKELMRN